jgi:hypothetical protein
MAEWGECERGRKMFLTPEQMAMLNQKGTVPITIDGTECVVVRADVFDRLQRESKPEATARPREIDLDFPAGWNEDGSEVDVDDYLA